MKRKNLENESGSERRHEMKWGWLCVFAGILFLFTLIPLAVVTNLNRAEASTVSSVAPGVKLYEVVETEPVIRYNVSTGQSWYLKVGIARAQWAPILEDTDDEEIVRDTGK